MHKLLKVFSGKKVLGSVILAVQLAFIAITITGIYETSYLIYGGISFFALLVIIFEINRESFSGIKAMWFAIIAIIPIFGIFLYVYVQSDYIIALVKRRLGIFSEKVSKISENITADLSELKYKNPVETGIFNYLGNHAYAPCFKDSNIEYFRLGEHMYQSLIEDIQNARKYIFIEMFIINENDYMWKRLHKILASKAKKGVEVRIVYDAMGSLGCTGKDFEKNLRTQGIKCCAFAPVKPFVSTYHNNRDHRKMIIIDGKCAYTGGVNFADEYINKKLRFGHWKDTAVKITGEGVKGFLLMYFKIWNLETNASEDYTRYIDVANSENKAKGYICAFDDTPVDSETITENIFLHIINSATEYVYINTPYLVLDDTLSLALKFAAKRGVDVKICMPHIPDKWYAFAVARTYYPELIKSGVSIYEYTPGFIHAKSTVSDNVRGYIGSANYDFRSLYHNYECGVYIYGNDVIEKMTTDFNETLKKCNIFTMDNYRRLSLLYRICGRVLRFFSPLL